MSTTATELGPGVYYDVPAEVYHDDPVPGGSMSSTIARNILPPGCPAKVRHDLDNGRRPSASMTFGQAAHRIVLGAGEDIVEIEAKDYRTKDAKAKRDEALEAGKTPILTKDMEVVDEMAAALRAHPAAALLTGGRPEVTIIWRDAETGVMCRARIDWLPDTDPAGRALVFPDYKTCQSADPDALSRDCHTYGYHQQGMFYRDGILAAGLHPNPVPLFICQEKSPPYVVTTYQLDHMAARIGQARNRDALALWRHCNESGRWPAYVDDVHLLSLPPWVERREGDDL